MKNILLLFAFVSNMTIYAQEDGQSEVRDTLNIYSIDAATIKEVVKTSEKQHTLLFTFASWCEPCHLHLPTAIKLAKDYNIDLYVVIVDAENSDGMNRSADFICK